MIWEGSGRKIENELFIFFHRKDFSEHCCSKLGGLFFCFMNRIEILQIFFLEKAIRFFFSISSAPKLSITVNGHPLTEEYNL